MLPTSKLGVYFYDNKKRELTTAMAASLEHLTTGKLATALSKWLAAVCAVTVLLPYLEGAHFTVRTYHQALQRILTVALARKKLVWWR